MVNQKIIEIWKRKASEGDEFAIKKLQELGLYSSQTKFKVKKTTITNKNNFGKTIQLRIDNALYTDLQFYIKRSGIMKNGLSDCLRRVIKDWVTKELEKNLPNDNPCGIREDIVLKRNGDLITF